MESTATYKITARFKFTGVTAYNSYLDKKVAEEQGARVAEIWKGSPGVIHIWEERQGHTPRVVKVFLVQ